MKLDIEKYTLKDILHCYIFSASKYILNTYLECITESSEFQEDLESISRSRRDVEELEPFDFNEKFDFDFENTRFKRDVEEFHADDEPDIESTDGLEDIIIRYPRESGDVQDQENTDGSVDANDDQLNLRNKRQVSTSTINKDVVGISLNSLPFNEWNENATHRMNVYNRFVYPLSNDIPAKIVANWFYNATHKIDLVKNQVHSTGVFPTSTTSKTGYQIVTWFYEGMVKTDTFRDLSQPIENPTYSSSVTYKAPNYTSLYRNDTQPQKMPEWNYNGSHLVGTYNRMVIQISNPEKATLVSNWFNNATHQIDLVKNKVYAFPTNTGFKANTNGHQVVTWYSADGFIKSDTYKELKEPIYDISFNVAEIYNGGNNFTSLYKNVTYERQPEWNYNGTHLVNIFTKVAHPVPSPVKAVLVGNVYNNITHQTDFISQKTYPVRGQRYYQTLTWYFNGLIRTDTLYDLEEPIVDPVFDVKTIYYKEPNSTYIYKNDSRNSYNVPPTYVPPEQVGWMFNKTHIINNMARLAYPVYNPVVAKLTMNYFFNATHKIDLLNGKTYTSDSTYVTSSTSRAGYQIMNWLFDGIVRTDTFKELYSPIMEPKFEIGIIYNKPPNTTNFYRNQDVPVVRDEAQWISNGTHKIHFITKEAYPVQPQTERPPEWIYNGTHKINTYTKLAYPIDTSKPPPPPPVKDEWIFNGTHKINLQTKESYNVNDPVYKPPVANFPSPPSTMERPRDEFVFNGTHKVNYATKEAYPVGEIGIKPPPPPPVKDEWIFNGTHKVNLLTKESYFVSDNLYKPPIANFPSLPSTMEKHRDEFVFNGTHKVNYATKEAYPVGEIGIKPPPPMDDRKEEKPEIMPPVNNFGSVDFKKPLLDSQMPPENKFESSNPVESRPLPPTLMGSTKDEFVFNGTHKVNYMTNEAYPVNNMMAPPSNTQPNSPPVDSLPKTMEIKPPMSPPVLLAAPPARKEEVPMKKESPKAVDTHQASKPVVTTKKPSHKEETTTQKVTKKVQVQLETKSTAAPKLKCSAEEFKEI